MLIYGLPLRSLNSGADGGFSVRKTAKNESVCFQICSNYLSEIITNKSFFVYKTAWCMMCAAVI